MYSDGTLVLHAEWEGGVLQGQAKGRLHLL